MNEPGAMAARPAEDTADAADWYKDAILYELHIKAFQDSTGDGIGDFEGLISRLDYLADLGITAIWLLPFYPSPLRDDGYDIADYRSVNPSYGDMESFDRFLDAAHARGMRVITELVINHTSDQHPWFQRAREAESGSAERDYYVWSDTDARYEETRIIFIDTEISNWTWDPVAKAYFWHRFYAHQPDLNFDNPKVFDEIVELLHYWLSRGVDGLRLDAVPYLVERDGTNNENLPETHEVLKRIRKEIDAAFPDRMLLAEANQWPEDTRPYFGDGDECHMAFHFPLMPRMYMALAQEDRHPITDILRQTPSIPESCQWAIFLRNHDELTLEMVTDEERDYLWQTYASELRARLNLGIRRRLAPLLDNDRRKIELMNGLLFSMPGTPVVYYGDELGMGDNFYLGDRDGVRTPMQWSDDRNGGFSRCDPQRLYLPPLMDPVYGYHALNVEAQQKNPSSLLNWMKRIVEVRRRHPAFSRGTLTMLYPGNRRALAYIREHDGERILCVANLARSAQAVELDLKAWSGTVPVELLGRSAFPRIGELPYLLTLPAYGFFWFLLTSDEELPDWYEGAAEPLPEFITLVVEQDWRDVLATQQGERLQRDVLPEFLARQRWFAGKDSRIEKLRLVRLAGLKSFAGQALLAGLEVSLDSGESQRYLLPLSADWSGPPQKGSPRLSHTLAQLRRTARVGTLHDGGHEPVFARILIELLREGDKVPAADGAVVFERSSRFGELGVEAAADIRVLGAEQSNASFVIGDQAVLKLYRRLHEGPQPDHEMSRHLTERADFDATPAFLGAVELKPTQGNSTTLAVLHAFVRNQGDAWTVVVDALARAIEDLSFPAGEEGQDEAAVTLVLPLDVGTTIGRRTAEMHNALAAPSDDPAFGSEPVTADDSALWTARAHEQIDQAIAALSRASLESGAEQAMAEILTARADEARTLIETIGKAHVAGKKHRIHGDFHLGQVLVTESDVVIVDFEGEPMRPLAERREKSSGLRDVAGMLRSLDYAAWAALDRIDHHEGERHERHALLAESWRRQTGEALLRAYGETAETEAGDLLDLFTLQKAFYEIGYEAANRPAWLSIPLRGVLRLLDRHREET